MDYLQTCLIFYLLILCFSGGRSIDICKYTEHGSHLCRGSSNIHPCFFGRIFATRFSIKRNRRRNPGSGAKRMKSGKLSIANGALSILQTFANHAAIGKVHLNLSSRVGRSWQKIDPFCFAVTLSVVARRKYVFTQRRSEL